MAACCYFAADLGKKHDRYSLSRLKDGTPYFSPDLLYFTFPFLFYLDKLFQVQLPFYLLFSGQKFSKSNSSSLFSSDKNTLSPISIPQNYSKSIPVSVLTAKSIRSQETIPSPFFSESGKLPLSACKIYTLAAGV